MNKNVNISVVIPVHNEEGAVSDLYAKLINILEREQYIIDIIFVNDGSTDNTLEVLKKLSPARIINFRKNFGQTAAMDAGIKYALGEYIATIDGDGQNDPADIPRLLNKLREENLDAVSGWRRNRKDPILKKFASRCMACVRRLFIDDGIHDSGCTLKVYKRECFENIDLIGEMHRFIPALLKIKGFRVGELEVNHHERKTGKTKYNWTRGIKGNLDLFSVWFWKKYASRPLHLFGTIGFLLIFVSILSGIWAIYKKIFVGIDLSDTAMTDLSMFGFMTGIQFFVFGLLADMLSKIYFASTRDKVYDIKEIFENK